MSKKILSLDLGITSIGYSILEGFENDRYSLIDYGVSMFDKPTDKDGKSKKLLHSASASASNLVRLRKQRRKNLAKLFEDFNLGEKEYFLYHEKLWQKKNHTLTPKWELRAKKAFEEKLKIEELFTILYAIAKHRGYKSLDTNDLLEELCVELKLDIEIKQNKKDEEKGKIKQALKTIENLRQNSNKTVAQIIYDIEIKKENSTFRNHDNYRYMIRREYIDEEIEKIILSQAGFGLFDRSFDVSNFIQRLKDIITFQKPSTNDENLFAPCVYYPEFKSAHKYSIISDIFKMYQSVSNITFNKNTDKITQEQIKLIADDFFSKIKKGKSIPDIKYKDIRKILKLSDDIKIFNKNDEKRIITKFHFVSILSKIDTSFIVDALEKEDGYEELKEIFKILQFEKDPKYIFEQLQDKIEDTQTIITLIKEKIGNSLNISQEAMIKFIPYFEKGMTTDNIKKELDLDRNEDYSKFQKGIKYLNLTQFENDDNLPINNHPVKYVVSATLRLIKHLHSVYENFDEIRVESTRELSQNEETKKAIEKANRTLEKQIDDIVSNKEYQKIAEHYGKNLRKYARRILMYEEQNRRDIYTGEGIEFSDIFTNTVDLDHIVPQSLGGLSVKHNFVLVHRDSNLQKSNQLPMNFIVDKQDYINRVEDLFKEHKINWKKKINLLATNLDDIFKDTFESKSLRATSYIEALTAQILKRYYPFLNKIKQKDGSAVRHIQGRATSNIRKVLKVKTKTRDTNIHHAIDAILIGLTNNSWLKKLSDTFRDNLGVIDEKAREKIKKDFPVVEVVINNDPKYLEPKELINMIEGEESKGGYLYYGEDSVFYKDIWNKTKAVNFWVSKKPMVSKVHKDTIYGKKENGVYTVRENIINKFISLKLTPTTKVEEFSKKFEKDILSKMYLYKTNPNDAVCKTVQNRADEVLELLKGFMWLDAKDKEVMSEAKKSLDELIHSDIYDNNGNTIRKIKLMPKSNPKDGFEIRGGLAVSEKTFIGFKCNIKNNQIIYQRIDVSNAKKVNNRFTVDNDNSFIVYKNDLIFFIYPDGSFKGGKIVSFLEDKKMGAFSNPRFPASISNQPYSFLTIFNGKPNSHKQHSLGKAIGIIKLNLDILGNIKSYQKIGSVESELLEFIKDIKNG